MRVAIAVLLLALPAFAQDKAALLSASCGPANVTFDVKADNSQHTLAQPETGKALVYIIQQSGLACGTGGWCVMRVGMDGAWVGAFKATNRAVPLNAYLYVPVEPGEHHVCVNGQSGEGDMIALARFTAEAGKVYFLRAQGVFVQIPGELAGASRWLDIGPMDSDEAKYLIATSPLSVSTPKK